MTISQYLSDPESLLLEKPYVRRIMPVSQPLDDSAKTTSLNSRVRATIPAFRSEIVTQQQILAELDPYSHKVLFDENIPSITVKSRVGSGMIDVEYARLAIPFQRLIRDKQVLHLCANRMDHTMLNPDPSEKQQADFIAIKQAWDDRNMEGKKTQLVSDALGQSKAGLLFYFDRNKRIKARNLSYADGYQLVSINDDNGDRLLEVVYYCKDNVEYIDCYDDKYRYRFTNDIPLPNMPAPSRPATKQPEQTIAVAGWRYHKPMPHGFDEIPLVTKHCRVAWDAGQSQIEVIECNANIYAVSMKKLGIGMLYIKGQFKENAKRIAGNVVLNDNSMDEHADAKILNAPDGTPINDWLDRAIGFLQLSCGTTFLLPKDIKISGDTSGLAIQLTQELDIETARKNVIDWQNVASKMMRLFKHGLAKEKVASGQDPTAITDYEQIHIASKFCVWRPQSDNEYNTMLAMIHGAGGISQQTLVEKNTLSTPDEIARIRHEADIAEEKALAQAALESQSSPDSPQSASPGSQSATASPDTPAQPQSKSQSQPNAAKSPTN